MNFINFYGPNSIIIFIIFLLLIILILLLKFFFRKNPISIWFLPAFGLIGFVFGLIIGGIVNYPVEIATTELWFDVSFEFINSIGYLHITVTALVCIFTSGLSMSNFFYNLVVKKYPKNFGITLLSGLGLITVTMLCANLLRIFNINTYDSHFTIANDLSTLNDKLYESGLGGYSIWTNIISYLPTKAFRHPLFSISFIIFLVLSSFVGIIFALFFQTKYSLHFTKKINRNLFKTCNFSACVGIFSFLAIFGMSSPIGYFWNNLGYLIINIIPFIILLAFNFHLKSKQKSLSIKTFNERVNCLRIVKQCCFTSISASVVLMFANHYGFQIRPHLVENSDPTPIYNLILPWVTLFLIGFINIFIFANKASIYQSSLIKMSASLGTSEIISGLRTGIFIPGTIFVSLVGKKIYHKFPKLQEWFLWI